jgi:hypothetical protein
MRKLTKRWGYSWLLVGLLILAACGGPGATAINIASGGAIVLTSTALFLLALIFTPKRGVVARRRLAMFVVSGPSNPHGLVSRTDEKELHG